MGLWGFFGGPPWGFFGEVFGKLFGRFSLCVKESRGVWCTLVLPSLSPLFVVLSFWRCLVFALLSSWEFLFFFGVAVLVAGVFFVSPVAFFFGGFLASGVAVVVLASL